MNVIDLAQHEIAAGWEWIKTEAVDLYEAMKDLISAPLKAFKDTVLADLWGAAAAVAQKTLSFVSLADLETAFLNTIQLLSKEVWAAAIALGSTLLQSLLGILQAKALA